MPQFVTDLHPASRAIRAPAPSTPREWRAAASRAWRARLATLRERAPDTLRARVRRELREAAAAVTGPE